MRGRAFFCSHDAKALCSQERADWCWCYYTQKTADRHKQKHTQAYKRHSTSRQARKRIKTCIAAGQCNLKACTLFFSASACVIPNERETHSKGVGGEKKNQPSAVMLARASLFVVVVAGKSRDVTLRAKPARTQASRFSCYNRTTGNKMRLRPARHEFKQFWCAQRRASARKRLRWYMIEIEKIKCKWKHIVVYGAQTLKMWIVKGEI